MALWAPSVGTRIGVRCLHPVSEGPVCPADVRHQDGSTSHDVNMGHSPQHPSALREPGAVQQGVGQSVYVRDLAVLSDLEFEELIADLLAAELGRSVERFARGPDGGVDLRWDIGDNARGIGQCKHYSRSTFPQLLAAARAEVPHLQRHKPPQYRFITSQDLTPRQKDELARALSPWIGNSGNVLAVAM